MINSAPARPRHRRAALMAGALAIGLSLVGVSPAFAAPALGSVTLTLSPTTLDIGDTVVASATLVATSDVFAYEVTPNGELPEEAQKNGAHATASSTIANHFSCRVRPPS